MEHVLSKTGWLNTLDSQYTVWAFYRIRKIAGCACTENAGNIFPAIDFKGDRSLAIPACITVHVWRTCRDACRIADLQWLGERSRHSQRMRNPQFYVSGKRPIAVPYNTILHTTQWKLKCSLGDLICNPWKAPHSHGVIWGVPNLIRDFVEENVPRHIHILVS